MSRLRFAPDGSGATSVLEAIFQEIVSGFGPLFVRTGGHYSTVPLLQLTTNVDCGELIGASRQDGGQTSEYYRKADRLLLTIWRSGESKYWVTVAGENDEDVSDLYRSIMAAIPEESQPDDEETVRLGFWSLSPRGEAISRQRVLTVPIWNTIQMNYDGKTRAALDSLMDADKATLGANGRLILWHGPPGAGKSFAIRSLLQHWRKWCEGSYIMDPEQFFRSPNYMLDVMLNKQEQPSVWNHRTNSYDTGEQKWNLIVVEDSDEFLTADAKDRSGQSVSRLLNVTDGLMGQGLNTLVLITTNEPIEKIHPAIIRAGRCMANIEFGKLSNEDVSAWYDLHAPGYEGSRASKTLAELYASIGVGKIESKPKTGTMGFGR